MSKEDDKLKQDKEAFRSDLGHKAGIERWENKGEDSLNVNFALQKLGQQIKQSNEALKEADYLGSAAVHYYKTPLLDQPYFVCQAPLGKVPEVLASHGIVDLTGKCMEFFGKARQTKRSGF